MELLENSNKPNLQKLDQIASAAKETVGTESMQPGTKIKNKGGRPPLTPEQKAERAKKAKSQKESVLGAQSAPDAQSAPSAPMGIPSKEIAKPIAQFISSTAVSYVGDPRASMTPEELENLSLALGMVMDKYMPDLLNKYGPEAMLCICLGQYGIRVIAMKKYLDAERAQKMKNVTTPQNPKPSDPGEVFETPEVKTNPEQYAS